MPRWHGRSMQLHPHDHSRTAHSTCVSSQFLQACDPQTTLNMGQEVRSPQQCSSCRVAAWHAMRCGVCAVLHGDKHAPA